MISIQRKTLFFTSKICFDMQQNQPLPKLSVGEVFYSRQIWLYNLTFVRHDTVAQSRENVSIYTWLETQSGRGANEVSSALIHYLDGLETKLITEKEPQARLKLRLFSDACSSQNKNSIVIACLKRFADRSVLFTGDIFFPNPRSQFFTSR